MPETSRDPAATEHRIVVPAAIAMVGLLGSADELLRIIESAFPGTRHPCPRQRDHRHRRRRRRRPGRAAVRRAVLVLRTGQTLTADAVERSVAMLRSSGSPPGRPRC